MTQDNEASMGVQSKGGNARRDALTPEERSAIARKAAEARWNANVPQATHEGPLKIGGATMTAFVLPNGKRLLSQATFLRAIGRASRPKAGTGALATADGLPFFLQAEALRPFISDELKLATTPIFFRTKSGKRAVGYDAELLPMVCEVYLKLRDSAVAETGRTPGQYEHIIRACDLLTRALAHTGILALVDEATGYQEVRDRHALQAILDRFLRKELAAWAKRFPDEFYQLIFKLRGWQWKGMSVNRPQVVAAYTKDLIYSRLAPGILKELEKRTPKDENGARKAKFHQWLTDDVGHPALAQHLHAVIALMRAAQSWEQFMGMINVAFPKRGDTLSMPFMADVPTKAPRLARDAE
jgi:hypothetical protein